MASNSVPTFEIPALPSGTVQGFIPYISKNPKVPIAKLLEPYKAFESELRKVYAQEPSHEIVKDGNVNLVPIFAGHEAEVKIRARSLKTETEEEKSKYIMALKNEDRRSNGAPAVVSSLKEFQQNFNVFSESSLADLDWSNVVAAGSAVTAALLPVPEKWAGSKRGLREYYHQHLAPASDVDLFIYGLDEKQALEKIKQIEKSIKDSILHETTTIRSKNAITIASQYPTRHVQIVLRLYDSVSQIITGFDVDCACAAYTGDQIYAAPRAVAAFMTQCNTIDLTRRSPSYENRLSKYGGRGFEAYWPLLDRSRVDPTIFERSFGRTQGLARLLILEKLPRMADRDKYMDQRRSERGRPGVRRSFRNFKGDLKAQEEDEVAEWVEEEDVSSYHTVSVPYGPKYHAAKINRFLYAKDLLLNAEWNQTKDREVYLHRHPCFFGTAEEIFQDCCGYCPVPKTDDEIKIAEEEEKTFVSGKLKFLSDNPGRQEIGSFNPITDNQWTTMAYIGDTARLCQAIVDGDFDHVEDWCAQKGVDVNRRDYTGRTPLHLAVLTSTPEIVQCLIDSGARLTARLVDGKTALHIAAARGNAEMVKALMDKSLENEEEEYEKENRRRTARQAERKAEAKANTKDKNISNKNDDDEDASDSEASEITLDSEQDALDAMTMGSFVKLDTENDEKKSDGLPEDSTDEPDVYDVNVIAWDYGLSPLHLAILNGHLDAIKLLVDEYGADVLLPVKIYHNGTTSPSGAIMTIMLAACLPPTERAIEVANLLVRLGVTSAQADMNHYTALNNVASVNGGRILDILFEHDRPAALSILNNVGCSQWDTWEANTPLTTAICGGFQDVALMLLEHDAKPEITFEKWVQTFLATNSHAKNYTPEQTLNTFKRILQPLALAAMQEQSKTIINLLAHGADPNILDRNARNYIENPQPWGLRGEAILDIVRRKLKSLREYTGEVDSDKAPETLGAEKEYTQGFIQGSYQFWTASHDYQATKTLNKFNWDQYEKGSQTRSASINAKKEAIAKLIQELEEAEKALMDAGAKTFNELYPKYALHDNPSNQKRLPFRQCDPEPYKITLSFQIPDLNDTKKDGYIRLFEATWNNDSKTVKQLTLASWEVQPGGSLHPPLRIAIQDKNNFSPFSIAALRGHYDLARMIVEISKAQYHKDDDATQRKRWNMLPADGSDTESEDGDTGLPIFSELVSDRFTIDNLGEVSDVVKSDILPLTMIEWTFFAERSVKGKEGSKAKLSLLDHAVAFDNMALFQFVLCLLEEQRTLLAEQDDDKKFYTIPPESFYRAIRSGRISMLAEMIRRTGVGISFTELVKTSGIELQTKPKFYQGLTVGGKKHKEWAKAPGEYNCPEETRYPPLLEAACAGCLDSVEWFMSDAPMRRYKEFVEANQDDKTIITLENSERGIYKTIESWLSLDNELVLHCATLHHQTEHTDPKYILLIKHLVSILPKSLEQKSSEGLTPLHLAVRKENEELVSYFLSVGANPRQRDKLGRNVIHMLVATHKGYVKSKAEKLESMIKLFDKEAVKEMMLERCNWAHGTSTPLALWMACNKGTYYKKTDVIEILAKYSTGEDLEMINGEGDLPLHTAVKKDLSNITSHLISLNPNLLYREDATGRTPLEMSGDRNFTSYIQSYATMPKVMIGRYNTQGLVDRPACSFVPKSPEPEENAKRTYEICSKADEELAAEGFDGAYKRKRRLVSLFEANEVAKRISVMHKPRTIVANGHLLNNEAKPDIVSNLVQSL